MGLMCRAQWMAQWVGLKMHSSHPVHFFSYFLPIFFIQIDYLLLDYRQLQMPTTTSHTNTRMTKGGGRVSTQRSVPSCQCPLLSQRI